jgi:hypothetical protein
MKPLPPSTSFHTITSAKDSKLFKSFERRRDHAIANLNFWTEEYHNDGGSFALDQVGKASELLGKVYEQLQLMNAPGAVVCEPNLTYYAEKNE